MRERNIFWDIAIVALLFLLVTINALTLFQNQSIEKRLIADMEKLSSSRGTWHPEPVSNENHDSTQVTPPGASLRGDENADDGDTLTLNAASEPNSLNYLLDNDAITHDFWELGTDYLAKRVFGHPNEWEPKLASSWKNAMICRGIALKKNAKELAEKLNAALPPDERAKLKIAKIDAESDDILRIELNDALGDYRDPVMKALGDGAIEQQHWMYISYDGEKFTDGTAINGHAVAERVRAAIKASPDFKGRFLPDWEREGSVAILIAGADNSVAEKAAQAYLASDANKGEVTDPKSLTGKSIKKVLTYDGTEHYNFEEKPVFTFTIRKGVRWHDGIPFTGKDIIFSYETMMNPKVEGPQQRNGYVDCESCKLVDGDPFTVQFVWKKPYFLAFASSCEILTFPEHIFHFSDGAEFNKNPKNQEIMGTGPYKLERRVPKQEVVLVRNDDYFGKKAHFKRLVFKFISDTSAALLSLKNGDLDALALRKQQAHDLMDDKPFRSKFNIEVSRANVYRYIGWNMRRDKFSTEKTRRALTMLIDRQRIIDKIFYGFAEPLDVPTHPESPSYPKDAEKLRIPFNVEAAKKLLAEDGWADTDGDHVLDKDFNGTRVPFRFTLLVTSGSPEYEAIANQVKDTFAQAGIDVNIRNLEWSVFLQNVERLNFDAMILGWQVGVGDDPYQLWHSSQTGEKASNSVGYVNKQVDQWIEEGRKELDTAKRCAIFAKVYTQIAQEQPYTCLFVEKRTVAYDKRIHNVVYNFQNRDWTRWWVPKELQKAK